MGDTTSTGSVSAAMQATKQGRAEQLRVLQQYLDGELTEFVSHQGKVFQEEYDPAVYARERLPVKIHFPVANILLDAAARSDTELGAFFA